MPRLLSVRGFGALAAIATTGALAAAPAVNAATATPAASVPACRTADFAAGLRIGSPGAGQRYATLVLRNRSKRTCHTFGYVGLQLVSSSGRALPTSTHRVRPPAPRTITLAPGAHAFAKLHWGAVNGSGDSQSGACQPTARTLQVTPPNQTARLSIRWTQGPVCERGSFDVGTLTR
jgi:hypothetical protein